MKTSKKKVRSKKARSQKRSAKVKPKTKRVRPAAPKTFFAGAKRGARGLERKQFHLLLDTEEYGKLVKLSHEMKKSAADVVRDLIRTA